MWNIVVEVGLRIAPVNQVKDISIVLSSSAIDSHNFRAVFNGSPVAPKLNIVDGIRSDRGDSLLIAREESIIIPASSAIEDGKMTRRGFLKGVVGLLATLAVPKIVSAKQPSRTTVMRNNREAIKFALNQIAPELNLLDEKNRGGKPYKQYKILYTKLAEFIEGNYVLETIDGQNIYVIPITDFYNQTKEQVVVDAGFITVSGRDKYWIAFIDKNLEDRRGFISNGIKREREFLRKAKKIDSIASGVIWGLFGVIVGGIGIYWPYSNYRDYSRPGKYHNRDIVAEWQNKTKDYFQEISEAETVMTDVHHKIEEYKAEDNLDRLLDKSLTLVPYFEILDKKKEKMKQMREKVLDIEKELKYECEDLQRDKEWQQERKKRFLQRLLQSQEIDKQIIILDKQIVELNKLWKIAQSMSKKNWAFAEHDIGDCWRDIYDFGYEDMARKFEKRYMDLVNGLQQSSDSQKIRVLIIEWQKIEKALSRYQQEVWGAYCEAFGKKYGGKYIASNNASLRAFLKRILFEQKQRAFMLFSEKNVFGDYDDFDNDTEKYVEDLAFDSISEYLRSGGGFFNSVNWGHALFSLAESNSRLKVRLAPLVIMNAYREVNLGEYPFISIHKDSDKTKLYEFVSSFSERELSLLIQRNIPGLKQVIETIRNNPKTFRSSCLDEKTVWDSGIALYNERHFRGQNTDIDYWTAENIYMHGGSGNIPIYEGDICIGYTNIKDLFDKLRRDLRFGYNFDEHIPNPAYHFIWQGLIDMGKFMLQQRDKRIYTLDFFKNICAHCDVEEAFYLQLQGLLDENNTVQEDNDVSLGVQNKQISEILKARVARSDIRALRMIRQNWDILKIHHNLLPIELFARFYDNNALNQDDIQFLAQFIGDTANKLDKVMGKLKKFKQEFPEFYYDSNDYKDNIWDPVVAYIKAHNMFSGVTSTEKMLSIFNSSLTNCSHSVFLIYLKLARPDWIIRPILDEELNNAFRVCDGDDDKFIAAVLMDNDVAIDLRLKLIKIYMLFQNPTYNNKEDILIIIRSHKQYFEAAMDCLRNEVPPQGIMESLSVLLKIFNPSASIHSERIADMFSSLNCSQSLIEPLLDGELNEDIFALSEKTSDFIFAILTNRSVRIETRMAFCRKFTELSDCKESDFAAFIRAWLTFDIEMSEFDFVADVIGNFGVKFFQEQKLPLDLTQSINEVRQGMMDVNNRLHLLVNYILLKVSLQQSSFHREITFKEFYGIIR